MSNDFGICKIAYFYFLPLIFLEILSELHLTSAQKGHSRLQRVNGPLPMDSTADSVQKPILKPVILNKT